MISALFPNTIGEALQTPVQILVSISPILLAWILFKIFWPLWLNYVRSDFFGGLKYAVLEIRLPREIHKSPLAMELVLNALHNSSDGGKFAQYWKGEKRPAYSFEIASIEGVVKFYVRTEDRRKSGVMSAFYSQYPGIEIHEVEDYTKGVFFDPKTSKQWGAEFILTKEDPYPIKTYVDYGLDANPKEEHKNDPMTPFLEFLGSIGANQQIWIQYIFRAHIKEQRKPGTFWTKTDAYKDEAQALINKIMVRDKKTKVAGTKDKETGRVIPPTLSEGEKEVIKAIERNMGKLPFDVGIRVIYNAKKELFDKPNGVGGIISSFKQYSTENFNGFKPNGDKWGPKFSGLPWEDYQNFRQNKENKKVLEAFKRRSFFYEPFVSSPMVLSSEEFATMYHFPGSVAATPTLARIPSKKSEAPANLPI